MKGSAALLIVLAAAAGVAADDSPPSSPPEAIAGLRSLETAVMAAADKALPSMVFIDGGSGVIVSPDGLVLTNNHVIADVVQARTKDGKAPGKVELTVHFTGGKKGRASVIGRDPGGDIALLKLADPGPYPFLELGDSDLLRPGQWVLAMGNPFLLGEGPFAFFSGPSDANPSVSLGIVSALHRNSSLYPDAIQVDVAVNPGSSGGPLLTTDAKVVGINGKIQTRFLIEVNSGVGYAVPSNQIRRFLEPLLRAEGGVVRRGAIIGLVLAVRGDADSGLEVQKVLPGSPGEGQGFRIGDRIRSIDGKPLWAKRRFEGLLATYPAGSRVSVLVDRSGSGEPLEIQAFLDPDAQAWLGVTGESVGSPRLGVRIKELVSDSPAQQAGLKAGDLIYRVNELKIETLVDFIEAIKGFHAGDTVLLRILREGREEKLPVRLGSQPND